jgi:hypothetical protein
MAQNSKTVKGFLRKVFSIGGSLAVAMPKEWTQKNFVSSGTSLSMVAYDNQLVIYRIEKDDLEKLMISEGAIAIIKNSNRVILESAQKKQQALIKYQKGKVKWQQPKKQMK